MVLSGMTAFPSGFLLPLEVHNFLPGVLSVPLLSYFKFFRTKFGVSFEKRKIQFFSPCCCLLCTLLGVREEVGHSFLSIWLFRCVRNTQGSTAKRDEQDNPRSTPIFPHSVVNLLIKIKTFFFFCKACAWRTFIVSGYLKFPPKKKFKLLLGQEKKKGGRSPLRC